MESQKTKSKAILSKQNQAEGTPIIDFKLYYKMMVIHHGPGIKIDMQTNGTEESPEINPQFYSQFILDKGAKNT